MSKLIVGIDGSEGSQRALQWAVEEGRIRNCPVWAVYAVDWQAIREAVLVSPSDRDVEKEAEELLRHTLSGVRNEAGVEVECRVLHVKDRRGAPGAMIDVADGDDDLIVVGTRGNSAIKGAFLGSISHRLLHYTRRPVVVVP